MFEYHLRRLLLEKTHRKHDILHKHTRLICLFYVLVDLARVFRYVLKVHLIGITGKLFNFLDR